MLNDDNADEIIRKIKVKVKQKGLDAKLEFLVKCLNLILLHKADPYLAHKHKVHLKYMHLRKKEEKEKSFYERMQEDIKKREKFILKLLQPDPQVLKPTESKAGLKNQSSNEVSRHSTDLTSMGTRLKGAPTKISTMLSA